jgi:Ankyrin repeats (3 copies)
MSTKLLSILSYLIIAGLLVFLVLMLLEPKSGSDASTRGIGKSMTLMAVAAIVFLVVFNLPINNSLKYLGLAIGLLCVAALVVILLALSGSSLVFQDTRTPFKPTYDDPVLTELFDAFHQGKVRQWKSLLQKHPHLMQHKQLLNDVMNDVYEDKKSSRNKLEALKYVLDSGVKIDTSFCSNLAQFAYVGKTDFMELMLQHGADPNCTFLDGRETPLLYVVEGYDNDDNAMKLLIKYGADVNAKVYDKESQDTITPLSFAAATGRWTCSMALLRNGADLYYKNKAGISIKEDILKKAENPEDSGYYKVPEFLQLVEEVKKR